MADRTDADPRSGGSAPPRRNRLALLSLCLLPVPPAAVVVGVLALHEIGRTGGGGRGLALTATVLGASLTAALLTLVAVAGALFLFAVLLMSIDPPAFEHL